MSRKYWGALLDYLDVVCLFAEVGGGDLRLTAVCGVWLSRKLR